MTTDLNLFSYEGREVRTITIDSDPWFVAADVCTVLEIGNSSDALRRLDDDEKGVDSIDTPGGVQQMAIVSEAGLYALILGSRKPQAKPFRRWVTHEVIPAIRKTGTYGAPSLSGPELLARAVIEAAQQIKELTGRADSAEQRVAELGPRAFAFDRWLSGNTAYSVDVVAKALRQAGAMTGRNRLFDFMEKAGWIFRQSGQWKPKQWTVEQKLLTVRLGSYEDSHTGELVPTTTIRITAKGAAKLAALHGVVQEDVAATLGGGESDAA